jgi:hypothetical protein
VPSECFPCITSTFGCIGGNDLSGSIPTELGMLAELSNLNMGTHSLSNARCLFDFVSSLSLSLSLTPPVNILPLLYSPPFLLYLVIRLMVRREQ